MCILQVDTFQALEQDLDVRKRFEEAASVELQQGWHRRDSDDSKRDSKEKSVQEKPEVNGIVGRDTAGTGRKNEIDVTLTNGQGKHDERVPVISLEMTGENMSRDDHANLSHQKLKPGNHKGHHDSRESGDLRRSSVEIQELLVQRFGSIRR